MADIVLKNGWQLQIDGASCMKRIGLGIILKSRKGDNTKLGIQCGFKATNNEAEYEAWIFGFLVAKDMGVKSLRVKGNSMLVIK